MYLFLFISNLYRQTVNRCKSNKQQQYWRHR